MRKLALAILLGVTMTVAAQTINPITQATLNAYNDILTENPSDYVTLYQRAMQYFRLSMLDKAEADVTLALQYTPDKEAGTKASEYALLANILSVRKDYSAALRAIENALTLQPDNFANIYMKGNICLSIGDLQGASSAFSTMLRKQPRSMEALYGLARIDILSGNNENARRKMQQMEDINSSDWTTFCRLGDLFALMKDNKSAATSYITGYALSNGQSRPTIALFDLADIDYPSVLSSLNDCIAASPRAKAIQLLKGNIAYNTSHYEDAISALSHLLSAPESEAVAVYDLMARSLMAMNRCAEGMDYIKKALIIDSTNPEYILTRAKLERGMNEIPQALQSARQAMAASPTTAALLEMAICTLLLPAADPKDAIDVLNQAILIEPDDAYMLALRAEAYDKVGEKDNATNDRRRIVALSNTDTESVALKALAMLKLNKSIDADVLLNQLQARTDADAAYYLAVIYTNTGDADRASQWSSTARQRAYSNLFNLNSARGPLTLRP